MTLRELLVGTLGLVLTFGAMALSNGPSLASIVIVAGGYLIGRADGIQLERKHRDHEAVK